MPPKLLGLLCIFLAASCRFAFALKRGDAIESSFWTEKIDQKGTQAHESMSKWLETFFATVPETDLAPWPPVAPKIHSRAQELPKVESFTDEESPADQHYWKIWHDATTCDDFVAKKLTIDPKHRKYLIIAPVGADFNASKWMTHPKHSTYDIIALYYGKAEDFTCPLCRAVIHGGGTKWELLKRYIDKEPLVWEQYYDQYEAIMVADDDLTFFDTCTLNRIFEIYSAYNIVLGQPSLCRTEHRSTWWENLYQSNAEIYSVLRYVTMVEIMAPIFRTDFFKGVVSPSLWNAYTGWGLDFAWPFLLRYPKKHIAAIDEVCMLHANPPGEAKGESNLYAIPVPYDEREEESRRLAEYGYYPSRVEAMGYAFKNAETLGMVKEVYCSAEDAPREGQAGYARESCPKPVIIEQETKEEEPPPQPKHRVFTYINMAVIAGLLVAVVRVLGKRKQQQSHVLKLWKGGRKPSKPYLAGLAG